MPTNHAPLLWRVKARTSKGSPCKISDEVLHARAGIGLPDICKPDPSCPACEIERAGPRMRMVSRILEARRRALHARRGGEGGSGVAGLLTLPSPVKFSEFFRAVT